MKYITERTKAMKKIVSLLLALVLIIAMSIPAFATEITIHDSEERSYAGYQLLNLSVSLKSTDTCQGNTHTDTCYNYAYTVNEKYEEILQALAGEGDILAYFAGLQGDIEWGVTGGEGTLRDAAEDIYAAILEANLEADLPTITDTDSIAQGYWLFVDVTDLNNAEDANSLIVLDTKGLETLTITPKTALPTMEKKVLDINDSQDGDIDDNTDWQDSADHDINDSVPFKLTATMPGNLEYYDTYTLVFHDTPANGLNLEEDTVQVFADGDEVTGSFTVEDCSKEGCTCTFTIGCADVLAIEGVNVTKDTVFEVYYKATLGPDDVVIGAAGNANLAYLEFSNNPNGEGIGKTEEDKVIVFTYELIINKVDAADNALPGAGFILYKKDAAGTYNQIGNELKGETMTTFVWSGLDDGDYMLKENTVPTGYNQLEDIYFTISAEHDEEAEEPALTGLTSTKGTANFGIVHVTDGTITEKIVNRAGTVLPETGAKGTMLLLTFSSMLVLVAAVFMITRKKMSVYED